MDLHRVRPPRFVPGIINEEDHLRIEGQAGLQHVMSFGMLGQLSQELCIALAGEWMCDGMLRRTRTCSGVHGAVVDQVAEIPWREVKRAPGTSGPWSFHFRLAIVIETGKSDEPA